MTETARDTDQAIEDELIYGVDLGIPGGDFTAPKLWIYEPVEEEWINK